MHPGGLFTSPSLGRRAFVDSQYGGFVNTHPDVIQQIVTDRIEARQRHAAHWRQVREVRDQRRADTPAGRVRRVRRLPRTPSRQATA